MSDDVYDRAGTYEKIAWLKEELAAQKTEILRLRQRLDARESRQSPTGEQFAAEVMQTISDEMARQSPAIPRRSIA